MIVRSALLVLLCWVLSHLSTVKVICQLSSCDWWRKTSCVRLCIISGTSRHLSKNTDILLASWIASSHERMKVFGGIRTHRGEGQMTLSQVL